jgi:REP element-mobilizing transposase RayT
MANTYTQIYIQFVFAVQNRACLIQNSWKNDLYKYITGIVQSHNHKMIAINGMPDHLHLFVGYKPSQSIPDLMQDVKGSSSGWINRSGFLKTRFTWQEGYGAFSYSQSQIKSVATYIENQESHHQKKSFKEEYNEFLSEFKVEYDPKFVFQEIL